MDGYGGGIEVRRLGDALGAEVLGVDLSQPLPAATFRAIHRAHLDHGVIVFRDQRLTPEQHKAFTRRFGPLEVHVVAKFRLPGHPEILVLSNDKHPDGTPVGIEDAGRYWHTDMSYLKRPALGSMLYAIEVPPEGGDTMFASMTAAYDGLPEATKRRLGGLRAIHHFASRWNREHGKAGVRPKMTQEEMDKTPPVDHPMVRTHPETGRKAIYAGGFTTGVVGMPDDEGRALLDEVCAHATQPAYVYRHKWRVRDLVFWDNRCLMHHATDYPPRYRRHMLRTTIAGDEPC